jgi:hypothetical protein
VILAIIFLGFVGLVIVAIKYDQIVPPTHNFIVSILSLKSFKKAPNQTKAFVLLFYLSLFFMLFYFSQFNKLLEFEDLLKIDAEKIEHYRESSVFIKYGFSMEISFKVNDQYYLKSRSRDRGYDLLKNAIKTGDKLTFWISPDDYSGKILQFSINGKIISPFKQWKTYHIF